MNINLSVFQLRMFEEKSQALGPAETPLHVVNRVVVSTQSFKYQYKYQYLSLK